MRGRSGLAIASILLLFSFLILARLDRSTHLFDLGFIQFEASLYFVSIIVLGVGAFFMFLFFAVLSPLRTHRPETPSTAVPERIETSDVIRSVEIAMNAGDFTRAANLIAEITVEHPDHWLAKKIAGDLAAISGSNLKAEQLYQQSIRGTSGEKQVPALLALAIMCETEGRQEEAEELFRRILRILPRATEALLRLRSIAIRNEKWDQALGWQEILEREIQSDAEETEERSMEGVGIRCELARSEMERGSLKSASALIKHVSRMTDSYPVAYLVAGEIQQKSSGPTAGFRIWDRGFRQTSNPVLLMRIGEFFLDSGLPENAIEYYQLAVRLKPENPDIQYCLAELHARLEMNREAILLFERLLKEYPEWPVAAKSLANLYLKTGKEKEASELLVRIADKQQVILHWQCYNCSMSFAGYTGHCTECGRWNTIKFNLEQAGSGVEYGKSPAFVRY